MLAKARHEFEINGQCIESAALTQIIQRFQTTFTLEWEGDEDDNDADDGGSQIEKSRPNPDDRLLKCLDSIASACRQLRSMGSEPLSGFRA